MTAFPGASPISLSDAILAPLLRRVPDRTQAIATVWRDLELVVESDAALESLAVSWGQVRAAMDGSIVSGDPVSIGRLRALRDSAVGVLQSVEQGHEPCLEVIAHGALITANGNLDVPRRALDFLTRATERGADPAFTRHLVAGFLVQHGYPWLWVPYQLAAEYGQAVTACTRGNGNPVARILLESIAID